MIEAMNVEIEDREERSVQKVQKVIHEGFREWRRVSH